MAATTKPNLYWLREQMAPIVAFEIKRIMAEETKGPAAEQKIRAEFERFLMFDKTLEKPRDMNIGMWTGRIGYSVDQATGFLSSLELKPYSEKLYNELSDRIASLSSEAEKLEGSLPGTITWGEAQANARSAERLQRSATSTVTETVINIPERVDNTIPSEAQYVYTKKGVYIGAAATALLSAATAYGVLIGDIGAAAAAGVFAGIFGFMTLGWKLKCNEGNEQIEMLMGNAEKMAKNKDNIFALIGSMEFSHAASQRAEKIGYRARSVKKRETALWGRVIPMARDIGPLQCNMLIGSAEKLLDSGNVKEAVARANDAAYVFDSLWPRKAEGVIDGDVQYLRIRVKGFFDHQEVVEYIREEDIKAENARQAAIAEKKMRDAEEARRRQAEYDIARSEQREHARTNRISGNFSELGGRGNPRFGTTAWNWMEKFERGK